MYTRVYTSIQTGIHKYHRYTELYTSIHKYTKVYRVHTGIHKYTQVYGDIPVNILPPSSEVVF